MISSDANARIRALMEKFSSSVTEQSWTAELSQRKDRRDSKYRPFSDKAKLNALGHDELCEMLEDLWALRGWHNKRWFLENTIGLTQDTYRDIIDSLSDLLFSSTELEERIATFTSKRTGFGIAIISEILTLADPQKYPLFNAKSQAVLDYLRIDLKGMSPRGRKSKAFTYYTFIKVYREILMSVKGLKSEIDDFFKLDAFFWMLNVGDESQSTADATPDENVIVVKMGRSEAEQTKRLWTKYSIASFGFEELEGFDPAIAGTDTYEVLRKSMQAKGAPEGLVKKVASYVYIFQNAHPNRDWVVAFEKGKIVGYGRVTSPYAKKSAKDLENWNHTIGVAWNWLETPTDADGEFSNLFDELKKNASVSLVKKRSAKQEFFRWVKGEEGTSDEEEHSDLEVGLTIDAVSLRTFLPVGRIEDLIHSFRDPRGKKQIIFDGPPGSGKTHVAQVIAEYLALEEGKDRGDWKLVPCHGGLTFEQMFQGMVPSKNGTLTVKKGIIAEFAKRASENEHGNYVLILDEINRANIPLVFGPLLYLLEYRGQEVDLPYDLETMLLPKNLFIIATMNSDDRSVGLVDFAFKRRFIHWRFDPSAAVLEAWLRQSSSAHPDVSIPLVLKIFDALNQKLLEFDRNFQIGHSYFMTSYPLNDSGLKRLWDTEVVPILNEKFYHERAVVETDFSLEKLQKTEVSERDLSGEDLVRQKAS